MVSVLCIDSLLGARKFISSILQAWKPYGGTENKTYVTQIRSAERMCHVSGAVGSDMRLMLIFRSFYFKLFLDELWRSSSILANTENYLKFFKASVLRFLEQNWMEEKTIHFRMNNRKRILLCIWILIKEHINMKPKYTFSPPHKSSFEFSKKAEEY